MLFSINFIIDDKILVVELRPGVDEGDDFPTHAVAYGVVPITIHSFSRSKHPMIWRNGKIPPSKISLARRPGPLLGLGFAEEDEEEEAAAWSLAVRRD